MKYKSIWQVLNSRNELYEKYQVIETLVDGILKEDKEEVKCIGIAHLSGAPCPKCHKEEVKEECCFCNPASTSNIFCGAHSLSRKSSPPIPEKLEGWTHCATGEPGNTEERKTINGILDVLHFITKKR